MPGPAPSKDPMGQILALAKDCDATKLRLTSAQGYLLSRIDGQTPWRLLREIGGIPATEVDLCLEQWLLEGLVESVGEKSPAGAPRGHQAPGADKEPRADTAPHGDGKAPAPEAPAAATTRADAATVPIDESALDERLELDLAVQRRILEFEGSLNLPYHELLGVPRGSDPKVVKRAYFKLSKEFHPDRYFRREIGTYTERLERIFKKVLEAHEMLSDPDLCQVENQPSVDIPPPPVDAAEGPKQSAAPQTPSQDGPPERGAEKARPVSKLERLRQRMPFKIDPKVILERRAKADEIFRSAMLSQRSGRRQEAESSIRIAISFDPNRAEFKEALGALRLEAAGDRAAKLLASPSDRMSDGELRDALRLLEDVLLYRPHDPQLNERAARVCMQLRKFDDAIEYAKTLIEGSPEDGKHHTLHGLILKGKGDSSAAVKALETALKYDAENVEARRALAALRIGHHDSVQGGRT